MRPHNLTSLLICLVCLSGCRSDPWQTLHTVPPDGNPEEWTWSILGHTVASETRIRTDTEVWRTLRHQFEVKGNTVRKTTRIHIQLSPDQRISQWSSVTDGKVDHITSVDGLYLAQGEHLGPEAFSLDLMTWEDLRGQPAGPTLQLDPIGKTVHPVELSHEETHSAWTGRGHTTTVRPGHIVRGPAAGVQSATSTWPSIDIVSLLYIPSGHMPAARRTRVMRVQLNQDAPRTIERPLVAELPATRLPGNAKPDHPLYPQVASALRPGHHQRDIVIALLNIVDVRLQQDMLPGTQSAMAAFQAGRGDCTEHTALFLELALAAGVPARAITGLVYMDGIYGPGFYPHAWAEVSYGERWVAVDPTLGQVEADATHIPLGHGLYAAKALERLPGLRISVLDIR